ncbi:SDR family NAD(P)-dependent oxidoreductase [Halomonas shantousis]
MSDIFQGRVAVITGAGSGIGRALALELASRGARLALSDVEADAVRETAAMAEAKGAEAAHDVLDVADRAAFAAYAQQTLDRFGRVNQLYNNAGISPRNDTFLETDPADFDRLLSINLDGVLTGTRVFLPYMIASGDGYLVNISSLNGLMAQPHMASYVTSKFAVRGFTEAIRMEMIYEHHPVEVTLVHPGGVATQIASRKAAEIDDLPPEKQTAARKRLRIYQETLLTMPAETAAREILDGMAKGRRRIVLTNKAKRLDLMIRMLPERYVGIVAEKMRELFD